ncbi:MAG: hypothetical protein ABIK09_10200 [Pseudomonadota bacterium]
MGLYENLGVDLLLDADGDLQISPSGDLAITRDGRTCLLQDVRNLLDTLPGDLFGHPAFGAGVPRLFGEEDRPDFERLVVRAITDALTYDRGVGPRIEPESIVVYALQRTGREAQFQVSFVALGEEWTSRLNLVWGSNTGPEDL